MTALGIGTFSVRDIIFSPLIALFATACSYFWFRTNLGSKFWQESWEVEVAELSKENGVRSFEKPIDDVKKQVRDSLDRGQETERRSFVRRWIDNLTVKKYSVTYNMILLSLVSTAMWFVVATILLVRLTASAAPLEPKIVLSPPPSAPTARPARTSPQVSHSNATTPEGAQAVHRQTSPEARTNGNNSGSTNNSGATLPH